jgi:hypothetical protein
MVTGNQADVETYNKHLFAGNVIFTNFKLAAHQHPVVALGIKEGSVGSTIIETEKKPFTDIDTVTLYINPSRQPAYYDYILSLHPNRIIFNPGTENEALEELAHKNNIATKEACTLVLLSTGQY